MTALLRRFLIILLWGLLLWPLAEVLSHESDNGLIFHRYSLSGVARENSVVM